MRAAAQEFRLSRLWNGRAAPFERALPARVASGSLDSRTSEGDCVPLYFAYGANMDVAAMAGRCPASKALGRSRLMNHRFFIMRDGVASVRRAAGGVVHGLLWDLALADLPVLDAFEDVAGGQYARLVLPVLRSVGAGQALVYVGHSDEEGRARPGYLENVIAAGEAACLPASYLRTLTLLLRAGTRGTPFINGPGPGGPVTGVRPRFATPNDRS